MSSILKYLLLPFNFRRGYRIVGLLDDAQNSIARDEFSSALASASEIVKLGKDRFFDARMFEAVALYHLGRPNEASRSFARALEIAASDRTLTHADRKHLQIYCYSHFKGRPWPDDLPRPRIFPELSNTDRVSVKISRRYPLVEQSH